MLAQGVSFLASNAQKQYCLSGEGDVYGYFVRDSLNFSRFYYSCLSCYSKGWLLSLWKFVLENRHLLCVTIFFIEIKISFSECLKKRLKLISVSQGSMEMIYGNIWFLSRYLYIKFSFNRNKILTAGKYITFVWIKPFRSSYTKVNSAVYSSTFRVCL